MTTIKKQLKNWLLQNSNLHFYKTQRKLWLSLCFCFYFICHSQIANYISNGSFENKYDCNNPFLLYKAKFWNSIDSVNPSYGGDLYDYCFSNVPLSGASFQYPRTGSAYYRSSPYCSNTICTYPFLRTYSKNRLKSNLISGKSYCVKMYVNLTNTSPKGIDAFGIYFGSSLIDTITKCTIPLTYITPQIQNPTGNIITDTLNWILITGTFVANGTEKYAVIGSFKSDAATTTTPTGVLPNDPWSEYFVDDVSCIDIDLPAYAGPDISCIPGNSVYIGRPQDVGIDEDCMWYKYPNMATAIDTAAGLWVSPVVTTTYIVKQDICGMIKWDTVIVYQSAVGLEELKMKSEALSISPNPANDILNISFNMDGLDKEFTKAEIMNSIGQLLTEIELNYNNKNAIINIKDVNSQTVSKRFVVAR